MKEITPLVVKLHNNVGANFFYHKSVLHSYMG